MRKLFVTIILSNSINKLGELWNKICECISDGILYNERRRTTMPGITL